MAAHYKIPSIAALPDILPVFPLDGVLLLPRGMLPLHIFEPRYLAMIDDALASNRLIGMVQPRPHDDVLKVGPTPLHSIGCAGKIIQFNETKDGRYIVALSGVYRFTVAEELPGKSGYRRVRPIWNFLNDMDIKDCLDIDRVRLRQLMQVYLGQQEIDMDCAQLDHASDQVLITALSMICPFGAMDKQALLEAPSCVERAQMFMTLLEMAVHDTDDMAVH